MKRPRRALAAILAILGAMAAVLAVQTRELGVASSLGPIFNLLAAERGGRLEADVAYGPLPRHRLDIYRAEHEDASRPIVLFIYGGGWREGEKGLYPFVGNALAGRGYTTVIADYRLFPEVSFPGFVEDAALAYRWVSQELAGACRGIVVSGHSAGAHIAALLALDRRYLEQQGRDVASPAGLIGLAGPYAFDPTTWPTTKDIFLSAADKDETRPVFFASPSAPPALLLHGEADASVKRWNMEELAAALGRANVPVSAVAYPGIGHVGLITAIARPLRWRAPVLDEMTAFLERIGRSPLACPAETPLRPQP